MNYTEFHDEMKGFPNFSIVEIEKHFPNFDSRRLVEWQQKGYIKRLRNRFYYFSKQSINESFLFITANEIYRPSYISLESALSKYGFIPEGVFQIISCSTRKTQFFKTPLGNFSYRHIKPDLYFGYRLEEWQNHYYAIAEPEKVLIDYLYFHPEVKKIKDIISLRWNAELINERISLQKLNNYQEQIGAPALTKRLNLLKEFLNVVA